jgi:hypothetical protein
MDESKERDGTVALTGLVCIDIPSNTAIDNDTQDSNQGAEARE